MPAAAPGSGQGRQARTADTTGAGGVGEDNALARLAAVAIILLAALAVLLAVKHYTIQQIISLEKQINYTMRQALTNNKDIPPQQYRFFKSMYTQSLSYIKKIVNIVFNGLLAALVVSTLVLGAEALAAGKC